MKIQRVKINFVRLPLEEPLVGAPPMPGMLREFFTVQVLTDDGIEGIGVTTFGGRLIRTLKAALDEFGELIKGEDPLRMEQVVAKLPLEAKTGKLLWRYKRPFPEDMTPLHPTNRGVGLLRRQGVLRGRRSGAGRARRQDRQGGVGDQGRRLQDRLLHDADAAGGRRQGDGRRVGRRGGHPRLPRRLRRGDRQGALAHLHGAGAGRARQRHLAEGRRSLEARRRHDVDDRHLRSGDQSRLLGHRQRGAVVRRSASRRQSLHLVGGRVRRRAPARSRDTSSITRTTRGTGTRSRRRSCSTTSTTAAR